MPCLCHQPDSLAQVSTGVRWFVFIVGLVETMVWSGTVFGWASLVHVMKLQGIYSNLCYPNNDVGEDGGDGVVYAVFQGNVTSHTNNLTAGFVVPYEENTSGGCDAQDARFALIYVMANVVYATPGILVGYALHHLGLAFTRVTGGVMITLGFLMLSLITPAQPDYLWAGMMLLSVGGNMIRMAALQLADLFPTSNTTALAIISGIYTPSAAVMMLLQVVYEAGVTWHHCCWLLALAASLVVVLTPLFPRHNVPYARPYDENNDGGEVRHEEEGGGGGDVDREDRNNENEQEQEEEEEEEEEEMKDEAQWSLKESVLSISSLLYLYWMSCNLFCVTLFGTCFNAWINKFANTKEETSLYSRWFGLANIMCVFFLFIPGVALKLLDRVFTRGKSGVMARVARIQSMISPMVVVSLSVTTQISMLLLRSPWAVYVGLVALIVNRPSILAVGNPFVRVRYPAEHFNRLQGFQGTTVALITLTQYPHFIWAQQSYTLAMSVMLGAMVLSLVQPLHLLCRQYLIRVLTPPPEAAILRSPLLRHAG